MALRKIRKNAKKETLSKRGVVAMECKNGCGNIEENVSADSKSVECAYCVQKSIAPPEAAKPKPVMLPNGEKRKRGRPRKNPEAPVKAKTGFPRGWHFKQEFIAPDGRVFVRGVEVKKK